MTAIISHNMPPPAEGAISVEFASQSEPMFILSGDSKQLVRKVSLYVDVFVPVVPGDNPLDNVLEILHGGLGVHTTASLRDIGK